MQEQEDMQTYLTEINYDKLIEKSLKNVVIEALKIAEDQGLPGENHFYITFKTNHPQTKISAQLKSQYPEEMTIVLQHQFSNLLVDKTSFCVDLSFGGVPQTLTIPYDAIIYFADPSAKFGLSFNEDISKNENDSDLASNGESSRSSNAENKESSAPARVISIDAFRKK